MFNPEELFVEGESVLKELVIDEEAVDSVAHFVVVGVAVEAAHSTPKTDVMNAETKVTMPETAEETDVVDVDGKFFTSIVTVRYYSLR